jgi:trans-2,3-dihydro-3-hydroxyanthranilate isomerase
VTIPTLAYLHLDVFSSRPFEGNQLAVFPDASGMDPAVMQRIAREFNFSETTFVLGAGAPGTDVRMRIFTPGAEVPIAGHPTIGTTFALAELGVLETDRETLTFDLAAGPTPVALRWDGPRLAFAWMTQPRPVYTPARVGAAAVAEALGIGANEVGPGGLPLEVGNSGVPFLYVPLRSRGAVDAVRVRPDRISAVCGEAGNHVDGVFVFAAGSPEGDGITAWSRMFAPDIGVFEDPATGIASGPLGGYLVRHGLAGPASTDAPLVSLQGARMGRPSRVHVAVDVDAGAVSRVRVGGTAVCVARGQLMLRTEG